MLLSVLNKKCGCTCDFSNCNSALVFSLATRSVSCCFIHHRLISFIMIAKPSSSGKLFISWRKKLRLTDTVKSWNDMGLGSVPKILLPNTANHLNWSATKE